MTAAGFPHSDTPGSQLGCQLPRAYRRLQRPSSALDAKASTMCPSQLASQTLNKNHKETQPHHPHNQGAMRPLQNKQTTTHTPKQGTDRCQMLASTIHMSHTHPHHSSRGSSNGPELLRAHGLISQGPTVCQTPTRPQPAPGSTPTRAQLVGRARAGGTERPTPTRGWFADDSTSEHHQCQPHRRRLRGVRAP